LLTAPTHKAAEILRNKTGIDVITIHSMLRLKQRYDADTGAMDFYLPKGVIPNMPSNALIVIEEASMINAFLLDLIRTHLPESSKLLWLGDSYQLNPVGSATTPVFEQKLEPIELLEVTRSNNSNLANVITKLRKSVIDSVIPMLETNENVLLLSEAAFNKEIIKTFIAGEDAKVLAWRNVTVKKYNKLIHTAINNSEDLFIGQKLVVNKPFNNTENILLNTETPLTITELLGADSTEINDHIIEFIKVKTNLGEIRIITNKAKLNKALKVYKDNKEWSTFYNVKSDFADVNDAYASSVHKSQGSTYHTCFVDLKDIMRNPKRNEMLRLLYVAMSRPSDKLVLLGG